jgi:predicted metalloprotease with PDZ domain
MIEYKLNCQHQLPYHIALEMTFIAPGDEVNLIIPYWRPGRYEAGNFAKNFINLEASAKRKALKNFKLTCNEWRVLAKKGEKVTVSYLLYGRELTAGNTYFDGELLLINPVNACAYVEGLENEVCSVELVLPDKWAVSTALKQKDDLIYEARDMQHLMDTPIMAASNVDVLQYRVSGINFFVHIIGNFTGDENQLIKDFVDFTRHQIHCFGSFPVEEYHFLLMFLPHRTYHGVEHENSTVIILGPAKDLDQRAEHLNLLGVSSHELYHTWNVKHIRPSDWSPYDFTNADYSRMGYVAEGVTTYMGDLMLWQAGVTSDEEFLNEMATLLKRHRDNEGRFNLSLGNSSIDTWVDGYSRGTPRRRVSIYVEGALLAFVCDAWLLQSSKGEKNLSLAMKKLFETVGKHDGYSEEDYWNILKEMAADQPWDDLISRVVDGKGHLEGYVLRALRELEISLKEMPVVSLLERHFGFQLLEFNGKHLVWNVFTGSPAEKSGVWFDDEVISINDQDPSDFVKSADDQTSALRLKIRSGFRDKTIEMRRNEKQFGNNLKLTFGNAAHKTLWKGIV